MDDDEALARRLQKEEAAFAARRDAEDASSLQQFLKTANVVSCPHGCGTLIERPTACAVPELRTAPAGALKRDAGGRAMGRDQVLHASTWRLRCAGCSRDFCGRCDAAPYHLGATCEEHAAPKCGRLHTHTHTQHPFIG